MNKLPVFIVLALLVGQASALTYMGSPTSNVKEGDLLLGLDYSDSEADIDWRANGLHGTIKDYDSDLYLGKVGLGLSDGFELFGRFGLNRTDYTLRDVEYSEDIQDGFKYHSGNEFTWGVGTKVTLGRKGNIGWGALFQYMDITGRDRTYLAVGPSYQIKDFCLYGGPFLDIIGGDVDMKSGHTTLASLDIEQGSEVGGYIGLGWQFAKNSSVSVEYQLTDDIQVIGVSLLNRFGNQPKSMKHMALQEPTSMPKSKRQVDASGRVITGYKMRRDASGNFLKDSNGNFVFDPVYEVVQGK